MIALGGGTFVQQENREALKQTGALTVLLNAPVKELERRCQEAESVRPLAQDKDKFEQLFASRQQAYALADFRVETTGKSIEAVAAEIEGIVRSCKNS